jgi:glycosyltransferase involved in cell wall biosynthesis
MRILWSIHLYPPAHNCGSEYVAHHVNKYLINKGHECRVILHRYDGVPYTYEGVEVFPATGRVDAFAWADIICTHLDFTQFSIIMANEARRPVIHFVHNDITYDSILNGVRGQHVCYNSRWIKDKLKYPHPSTVLHPPCDINYYNVNENPAANEYITLISLNERKGGYMLYKVAQAMPERKFMGVVGSYDNPGPMKLSQEQIVNMLQELSNVTIVPNSPDILSVYKKTRVLLMPSDYESWGRTATEAMCNGIPVICTPTDGLLENCTEAGIFVGNPKYNPEPGSASVHIGTVEMWINAIRSLDDPVIYEEKSRNCRARAGELNPLTELEALESFIMNTRF